MVLYPVPTRIWMHCRFCGVRLTREPLDTPFPSHIGWCIILRRWRRIVYAACCRPLQRWLQRWRRIVFKAVQPSRDATQDQGRAAHPPMRELDAREAAFDDAVRQELGQEFPILFDSGIRSGEDIIKALVLGADYVFLGRPFLFASALGRSVFIEHLIKILDEQIDSTMAQIGCTSLDSLDKNMIWGFDQYDICLLYTSPSPRDLSTSRMPSSA